VAGAAFLAAVAFVKLEDKWEGRKQTCRYLLVVPLGVSNLSRQAIRLPENKSSWKGPI